MGVLGEITPGSIVAALLRYAAAKAAEELQDPEIRAAVAAFVHGTTVAIVKATVNADLASLGAWLDAHTPPPGDPLAGGNAPAEHPPILLDQEPTT